MLFGYLAGVTTSLELVTGAGIEPRPARGRIPVWFGGHVEATLRRVGRIGDGWLPHIDPDEVARAMVNRMHEYAVQAGRSPAEIGLEPRLTLNQVPEHQRVDFVNGWRGLGATHLNVDATGLGLSTVDKHLAVLEDTIALLTS